MSERNSAVPSIGQNRRPSLIETPDGWRVHGYACAECGRRTADLDARRCPDCGSTIEPTDFGPGGVVWSYTDVHISDRATPFALAYVDLDDGPRILAEGTEPGLAVGLRVELTGYTDSGNPVVAPAASGAASAVGPR